MPGTTVCFSTGTIIADQKRHLCGANNVKGHPIDSPTLNHHSLSTQSDPSGPHDQLGPANNMSAPSNLTHGRDIAMEAETDCRKYDQENNAEKWFDESNKNVSSNRNVAFNNRDPPFYLTRIAEVVEQRPELPCMDYGNTNLSARSQSTRASLSHMESFESTSEDFRSVIDDLTVENQKLKQRLKAYKRFYTSHLPSDTLFEVRVHELPPTKKRKLVETLCAFVSSIADSTENVLHYTTPGLVSPLQPRRSATMPKPSSASTNNSHLVDSAYASLSISGHTSTAQYYRRDTEKSSHSMLTKNQNIKSYLGDIPEGCCPKYSQLMTEKSRKRLVVKRLEQLFTGTGASLGKHSQSHQQQEVSESAAEADRSAVEAKGQKFGAEGHREARILSPEKVVLADQSNECRPPMLHTSISSDAFSAEVSWSSNATPDQRPTRPLDLDPNRAQVAAENMEYIRHLGVASPELDPESSVCDGDGWVYLNLVIGMAQLHTINVTPDFVRKAVIELSEKLELSEDSRKIRWRGGTEGTRMSSDGCSSAESNCDESVDGARPANELGKTTFDTYGWSTRPGGHMFSRQMRDLIPIDFALDAEVRSTILDPGRSAAMLHYEPLFRQANVSKEEQVPESSDDDSLPSSGLLEDHCLNSFSHCQKREDGPIIFYHGASFCTDLSGDIGDCSYNVPEYSKITTGVLGSIPTCCKPANMSRDVISWLREFPKLAAGIEADAQPTEIVLRGLETPQALSENNVHSEFAPIPLEASGVSGIEPRDNFAIVVHVKHFTVRENLGFSRSWLTLQSHRKKARRSPLTGCSSMSMDRRSETTLQVRSEVFSARQMFLSPASLPPPSYVYMSSSSSSRSSSDSENEAMIGTSARRGRVVPFSHSDVADRVSPMLRYTFSRKKTHENTSSVSDASSIDMLAHARQIDPDTVAAQEREFDTIEVDPDIGRVLNASLAATNRGMS